MIRKVIAGVVLIAKHHPDLIIRENNPVKASFYSSDFDIPMEHQIHLRIRQDPIPVFSHHQPVFVANDSWLFYQDEAFYWIVLHPPVCESPLWVTGVNHGFWEGDVYCSSQMMNPDNNCELIFNPVSYPLDQILMMHYLATIDGMIIHSAGWRVNDSGWIFAGKSGAGKSTISSLIVETTGGTFLSDDRIIVRKIGGDFFMYGTPWPGEAGYAVNESVPLKGIFFLSKGENNSIVKLSPAQAIPRLMPVVSVPWYDREKVDLMMGFLNDLIGALPMYELTFVPDAAVVGHLREFIHAPF